jgi:hypothetical protein
MFEVELNKQRASEKAAAAAKEAECNTNRKSQAKQRERLVAAHAALKKIRPQGETCLAELNRLFVNGCPILNVRTCATELSTFLFGYDQAIPTADALKACIEAIDRGEKLPSTEGLISAPTRMAKLIAQIKSEVKTYFDSRETYGGGGGSENEPPITVQSSAPRRSLTVVKSNFDPREPYPGRS